MRSYGQALDSAARTTQVAPQDGGAWERLGRLRLRRGDRAGALDALQRGQTIDPSLDGLLDLALAYHLAGDVGAEVTAAEAATKLAPDASAAWSRYAHALARTERRTDTLAAAERALALDDDPEVRELRDRLIASAPRELPGVSAAA